MVDIQTLRKTNLRVLIEQWGGPTSLAKKLHYTGPSFISQLIGPGKPVTEKTARFIEHELQLVPGWLDIDHAPKETPVQIDSSLIRQVMDAVATALQDKIIPPSSMAELVTLVYEHTAEHNKVDTHYIKRLIKLITKD